jgi:hypothetical protein
MHFLCLILVSVLFSFVFVSFFDIYCLILSVCLLEATVVGKRCNTLIQLLVLSSPTQPPIQWIPGTLSPGVKRPGREADHSPPTIAEVQNTWIYASTPP